MSWDINLEKKKTNRFYKENYRRLLWLYLWVIWDFYNQAIHATCGNVKLNLEGMNKLLVILKEILVDPIMLHPLLLTYIHHK